MRRTLRAAGWAALLLVLFGRSGRILAGEGHDADRGVDAPPPPTGPSASPAPSAPTEANTVLPPLASDELTLSARSLFDAIVKDDPSLADDFFFPSEPFLRLKDVDDPARYHRELVRAYRNDVHSLHGRRRSWDGAVFIGFSLGSAPRWVKPGAEWNKIGYFRTFDGRLRYSFRGAERELAVRTIISWEGRWYVTHLRPVPRAAH